MRALHPMTLMSLFLARNWILNGPNTSELWVAEATS